MLQGWDGVSILESAVEYGNGHTLALHTDIVEPLSEQHLYLFLTASVELPLQTIPGVEGVVGFLADHPWDTVRRGPHMFCLAHTSQGSKPLE